MAYPRLPNAKAAFAKTKGDIDAALELMMSEAHATFHSYFLEQLRSMKSRIEIAEENKCRLAARKKAAQGRKEGRFDRRKFALSEFRSGKTFLEIGKRLGVKRERARQIVAKALREEGKSPDQIHELFSAHAAAARGRAGR